MNFDRDSFTRDYPVLRCSFCYTNWSFPMNGSECPECGEFSVSAIVSELKNLDSRDA